jgi:hypothetical protein
MIDGRRRLAGTTAETPCPYSETFSAKTGARADPGEAERGLVFVHPFDDARVIAGQGAIGLGLLEQVPDLDAVLVPVGGGGPIGGIAKTERPWPVTRGTACPSPPPLPTASRRAGSASRPCPWPDATWTPW